MEFFVDWGTIVMVERDRFVEAERRESKCFVGELKKKGKCWVLEAIAVVVMAIVKAKIGRAHV